MNRSRVVIVLVSLFAALARAQPAPEERDRVAELLYPPELIMAHQRELALDDKQRQLMVKEISATQARITEITWQLRGTVEDLVKLLGEARIDEAAALAQADKVMAFEREVKKAHLTLLVRLKNALTVAQRGKLDSLRAQGNPAPRPAK